MTYRLVQIGFLLNLWDTAATLLTVKYLHGVELNPVMSALLAHGAAWFVVVKVAGAYLGLALLGIRKADAALAAVVAFYGFLAVVHCLVIGAAFI